jgi:hypothetical protein
VHFVGVTFHFYVMEPQFKRGGSHHELRFSFSFRACDSVAFVQDLTKITVLDIFWFPLPAIDWIEFFNTSCFQDSGPFDMQ